MFKKNQELFSYYGIIFRSEEFVVGQKSVY